MQFRAGGVSTFLTAPVKNVGHKDLKCNRVREKIVGLNDFEDKWIKKFDDVHDAYEFVKLVRKVVTCLIKVLKIKR